MMQGIKVETIGHSDTIRTDGERGRKVAEFRPDLCAIVIRNNSDVTAINLHELLARYGLKIVRQPVDSKST